MENDDADDVGEDAARHNRSAAARMETDDAGRRVPAQRALDLADAAVRQGEVPVGAVFVVDGVEVARGANATNAAMDATRHAELVAVDAALADRRAVDWRNATLYVTCEPCIMCAAALAQLGLRRCFFGCSNEKFGGCGSILSLHDRAFPCVGGLRKAEAVDLFRRFYDRDNTKVPSDRRGDTRKRKRKKARADEALLALTEMWCSCFALRPDTPPDTARGVAGFFREHRPPHKRGDCSRYARAPRPRHRICFKVPPASLCHRATLASRAFAGC